MNIKKLIKKTQSFLSSDKRKRKEKRKFLKKVLKRLRNHECDLKEQLETDPDDASRAKVAKEIALVHAQRKKGIKQLKGLGKSKRKN